MSYAHTDMPLRPSSESEFELRARRSSRSAAARRAAATRGRERRRRASTGAVALLGAMTLAAGAAVAQDPVGGAAAEAPATAGVTLQEGDRGPAVRRLQRKLGLRSDGHFGPQTKRALGRWQRKRGMRADGIATPATLRALGVKATAATTEPRTASAPAPALQRIAQCESGGDPAAVSADGRYHGKYQFSVATWRAVGGAGLPSQAPESEQDRLATKLFADQGSAPWPVCGARA